MLHNDREEERDISGEPVVWTVSFADGTIRSTRDGGWDSFSDLAEIDGVSLYLSRSPISDILVSCSDHLAGTPFVYHALKLEEPARCFAFHRWRSTIRSGRNPSQWLYSAFGYVRGDERVILQVSQTLGRTIIAKRSTPFDPASLGND